MKVSSSKFLFTAQAALVVAGLLASLSLGACSRSGMTDSLVGPGKATTSPFAKGPGKGGAPPPPAPGADPCASLTGLGGAVAVADASVPQNRIDRLRIEIVGDVAAGTMNTLGGCATGNAPAVSFISGTASLSAGGGVGGNFTFGALAVPPAEGGVVLANDAAGNTLEIIWPALAGGAPGPPIMRLQLVRSGQAGSTLSVNMSFTAHAPDGTTATFTASAANLLIPALR